MKCPNCGADVSEQSFCPNCGADLIQKNRRRRRFRRNLDHGMRQGVAALVVLLTAISVLIVVLSAIPAQNMPEWDPYLPPEGSIIISDNEYIVLSGDFGSSMVAELNEENELVITLTAEDPDVVTYLWEFRNDLTGEADLVTKNVPMLTWMEPGVGVNTVTVCCYNSSRDLVVVYTGTVEYMADQQVKYTWDHGGKTMTVNMTVEVHDFLKASEPVSLRNNSSLEAAVSFVDPAGYAGRLEGRIWEAYSSAFGGSRTSADYASCLLEMISSTMTVSDDCIIYGPSVYWAYPVQTLYRGAGDSGDIAVLAASMLKAAGFDTGITMLPGMWAPSLVMKNLNPAPVDGFSPLSCRTDGKTYWISSCTEYAGLGLMPSCYSYRNGFQYYGQNVPGYGNVVC